MIESLLATCASAGATLIAIIGGLTVSQHIRLEAERAQQQSQLEKSAIEETRTIKARTARQLELDELRVAQAFSDQRILDRFRAAARAGDEISITEIHQLVPELADVSHETMRNLIANWLAEHVKVQQHPAWNTVSGWVDWREFKREFKIAHNLSVGQEAAWISEFRRRRSSTGLEVKKPESEESTYSARLRQATMLLDDAKADYSLARARRAAAELSLPPSRSLHRLYISIAVLGVLSVTTVVIPVLYLTPSVSPGPIGARTITGMFLLSVLALFGYMVWEIRDSVRSSAPPKSRSRSTDRLTG